MHRFVPNRIGAFHAPYLATSASLTTVNRTTCIPSTTQGTSAEAMRSARIDVCGVCRPEVNAARTLPGKLGRAWPCTARPFVRREDVEVERGPLGRGIQADHSQDAVQVARFQQVRLVAIAAAEAVEHVAEGGVVHPLRHVDGNRQLDFHLLAIPLVRLDGRDRLQRLARLDAVGDQAERLDLGVLAACRHVDLAVDLLDANRRHRVADEHVHDRWRPARTSSAGPICPVYRGPLYVSRSSIGSCPSSLMVHDHLGGQLVGEIPLGVDRVGQDRHHERGQQIRLADHLDVVGAAARNSARPSP